MPAALQDHWTSLKALKEEFEQVSVGALRAKSRFEALEKIIAEKEAKTAELEKENGALGEKIIFLTSHSRDLDSTIQHYQDVKR